MVQAKRDREWREFLERRTGDPSSVATVRKEKQRSGDEVSFRFPREWILLRVYRRELAFAEEGGCGHLFPVD